MMHPDPEPIGGRPESRTSSNVIPDGTSAASLASWNGGSGRCCSLRLVCVSGMFLDCWRSGDAAIRVPTRQENNVVLQSNGLPSMNKLDHHGPSHQTHFHAHALERPLHQLLDVPVLRSVAIRT